MNIRSSLKVDQSNSLKNICLKDLFSVFQAEAGQVIHHQQHRSSNKQETINKDLNQGKILLGTNALQ